MLLDDSNSLMSMLGAGLLNADNQGGYVGGFQNQAQLLDKMRTDALNRSIAQKRQTLDESQFEQQRKESEARLKAMEDAKEMEARRRSAAEQAAMLLQPNPMPPLAAAGMTPEERAVGAAGLLAPYDDKAMGLLMDRYMPPDPDKQYFTPLETDQGFQIFNSRTGKWTPMTSSGGVPYMKPASNPALQRELSGAKASGKTEGEERTKTALDLPNYESNAVNTVRMVEELRDHPGMPLSVGKSSIVKPWLVPGTKSADFKARLDQVQGRQFLEAFENLKGGGQITEVEGKKATDAISRMSTSQSEEEFKAAANEFIGIVKAGVERAQNKAGVKPAQSEPKSLAKRRYNPATGKIE